MKLNVKICEILNLSESAVAVVLYKVTLSSTFFTLTGVILPSALAVPESNNNAIDVATDDLTNLFIFISILSFHLDFMSLPIDLVFHSIVSIYKCIMDSMSV
ncbi:Uncharacterised protein [Staphylococcus aureus]|nr:Uncharacterised protein [Staphylococcus aureus]CAC7537677.1 Uncharacterised protein [Staphylococcus aureus]